MTIETYIKRRDSGESFKFIQHDTLISEGTILTLELSYQCYLIQLPLDEAIEYIQNYSG